MLVNTRSMVSLTEANRNFSRVARTVDEEGAVVILKNNVPRYVVIDIVRFGAMAANEEESIEGIAERIIQENLSAFSELAR